MPCVNVVEDEEHLIAHNTKCVELLWILQAINFVFHSSSKANEHIFQPYAQCYKNIQYTIYNVIHVTIIHIGRINHETRKWEPNPPLFSPVTCIKNTNSLSKFLYFPSKIVKGKTLKTLKHFYFHKMHLVNHLLSNYTCKHMGN